MTLGCVAATETQSVSASWGLLRPLCGVPCPLFDHISHCSDHHRKGAFPWNLPVGPSGDGSKALSAWGLFLRPPHGPTTAGSFLWGGRGAACVDFTPRFLWAPVCVCWADSWEGAHEGQIDAQEGITRDRWTPMRGLTRGRRTPGRGSRGQCVSQAPPSCRPRSLCVPRDTCPAGCPRVPAAPSLGGHVLSQSLLDDTINQAS